MSREWVTVPVEPTPEMVEEICRSHTTEEWPNAFGASAQEIRRDYARAGWAAALAAAPHPPIAHPDALRAAAVVRIVEAGASSQWHGIRSIVRLFDGTTLECSDTADEVHKQIKLSAAEGGA